MQQQALAREGAANKKEVGQQKGSCAACDDKNVLVFELACSHTYCTKCTGAFPSILFSASYFWFFFFFVFSSSVYQLSCSCMRSEITR